MFFSDGVFLISVMPKSFLIRKLLDLDEENGTEEYKKTGIFSSLLFLAFEYG